MSLVDHHGEVEYPFSQKTVFRAIMKAAKNINGLSLDSADEISGRVTFKAGISLASWGENIPVQLIKVSSTRTQMKIISTPKTGVMFGGTMDFGKNRENIEKIINAVSSVLADCPAENDTSNSFEVVEQLTKLKQLADQGVLSDEEYVEQKKRILNADNLHETNESVKSKNKEETLVKIESNSGDSSTNYAIVALFVFIIIFILSMLTM